MESPDVTRPLAEAFKGLFSKSEHIDYAVVDAFTDGAYGGNPAAVIVLPAFRDTAWMQAVAAEFNISQTCYLVKKDTKLVEGSWVTPQSEHVDTGASLGSKEGGAETSDDLLDESELQPAPEEEAEVKHVIHQYDLRWFTPTIEVDFCGHGTLASAHLLFETGLVGKKDSIIFHTKAGLLSVRKVGPKDGDAQSSSADGRKIPTVDMIELNFPWATTTPSPLSAVEKLIQTLKNVEVVAVGTAAKRLIVELASKEDVENLRPNTQELLNCDSDGLIATASAGAVSEYDFVSRCFFPKCGVDEVPNHLCNMFGKGFKCSAYSLFIPLLVGQDLLALTSLVFFKSISLAFAYVLGVAAEVGPSVLVIVILSACLSSALLAFVCCVLMGGKGLK